VKKGEVSSTSKTHKKNVPIKRTKKRIKQAPLKTYRDRNAASPMKKGEISAFCGSLRLSGRRFGQTSTPR
jgi:hypothetical protein